MSPALAWILASIALAIGAGIAWSITWCDRQTRRQIDEYWGGKR